MSGPMNVVILHDHIPPGAAPDRLDTMIQVNEVREALERLGHRSEVLSVSDRLSDTTETLSRLEPDMVFNLVESVGGSGRHIHLVPELLEASCLPFSGAGEWAMKITTNKLDAKEHMRRNHLPTPPWFTHTNGPPLDPEKQYIIKSVWEHGSVGLDEDSVFSGIDPGSLWKELESRRHEGGEWFIEEYIDGREFNVSLLAGVDGPEVLPLAEIVFRGYGASKPKVVGYRAKWRADSYEYNNTPRSFDLPESDRSLLNQLKDLSIRCWRVFSLRGWARVDFRVDAKGRLWILEVNANPCLSTDAGFMAAAGRAGLAQDVVVARILGLKQERELSFEDTDKTANPENSRVH